MKDTKIEWTTTRHPETGIIYPGNTFNPWIGCTRVSPGCETCYAEVMANRFRKKFTGDEKGKVWGVQGVRYVTSDDYWKQPIRWNRQAQKAGVRLKVFCASEADIFEHDSTIPVAFRQIVAQTRERLFTLVERTPWLNWLFLTKRIENVMPLVPPLWNELWWPDNVWIGASMEDQRRYDERIEELLRIPATVRFISAEPLLGAIDMKLSTNRGINWVIAGGESGRTNRPVHPEWIRSLRDQAVSANIPFFFKQWGEWSPDPVLGKKSKAIQMKVGGEVLKYPVAGSVADNWAGEQWLYKTGKTAGGRLLDGLQWDEMPAGEGVEKS